MPGDRQQAAANTGFVVVVLLSIAMQACARDDPNVAARKRAVELQTQTTPPNAVLLLRPNPEREPWSVESHWEFETDWDWGQYARWVSSRLEPEFKKLSGEEPRLVFSRQQEGDTERISIDLLASVPKTRVRVNFQAYPW